MKDEVEVLSEIEAIRQSPGMYIGSVGADGAHHLLYEVIHNSIDEAVLGHCNQIEIRVDTFTCEVRDNGRGIPTEIHSAELIPSCELALTRLHAGSKFRNTKQEFTAGLHGVGLACVNALSSQLDVRIDRKGSSYQLRYQRGAPLHGLKNLGETHSQGTCLSFSPDPDIFQSFAGFELSRCLDFVEKMAHLNPGVQFVLRDERNGQNSTFFFKDVSLSGLLAKALADRRALLEEPMKVEGWGAGWKFQAQFNWATASESKLVSFVNCVETVHGGTHQNAFRAGLQKAVNRVLGELTGGAWKKNPAEMDEICDGLVGIINCQISRPNFEGQTKTRLTNMEIVADIESLCAEQIEKALSLHPQTAAILLERLTETRNARIAAKRVAERIYLQQSRKGIDEAVYKEQFGARSKNWHDSAVWITHEELLKSHANLCQVPEDSIALDVCCGSGVVGASFRSKIKKIVGLDLTPEMVQLAKQRLDEVYQGNVYKLPFPDNSFDLVCTREVLHLLPYPERPVSEIFRVLKPGGQFIVGQILPFSEADGPWMYRIFKKKQPLIFNMFQEEDFRRLLSSAGFVSMEMTEMNVWESIDVWINSYETTAIHRHEIRELYRNAPAEAKAVHPFTISSSGEIRDLWRWCLFSVRKPK